MKNSEATKVTVYVKDNSVDEIALLSGLGNSCEKRAVIHSVFGDKYGFVKAFSFNSEVTCSQFCCYPHSCVDVTFLQPKKVKKWRSLTAIQFNSASPQYDNCPDLQEAKV